MLLICLSDSINKYAFITPWTFLHIFSGILFSLFTFEYTKLTARNSFIAYSFIHFLYECKDFYLTYISDIKFTNKNNLFGLFANNNTIINSIGDQIFGMIGWYIGYKIFNKIEKHNKRNNIIKILFVLGILLTILFSFYRLG